MRSASAPADPLELAAAPPDPAAAETPAGAARPEAPAGNLLCVDPAHCAAVVLDGQVILFPDASPTPLAAMFAAGCP